MVPETVAPFVGEVMETASETAFTVSVAALLVTLPAELLTTTWNVEALSVLVVVGVV